MPAAVAEPLTRVCRECGQEKPITAFSRNRYAVFSVCKACIRRARLKNAPRDRAYDNCLSNLIEERGAGSGVCPECGRDDMLFRRDDGATVCRICLRKKAEPARTCVICGGEIPAESSPLAKTCSERCLREKNRRYARAYYRRKRDAAAAAE